MFGIGLPELIVILAVALIVVGPEKLPDLAKTVAKQVLELKKAANDLKDTLNDEELGGGSSNSLFQTISKDGYLPEKIAARARELADAKEQQETTAAEQQETAGAEQQGEKDEDGSGRQSDEPA